MTHALPPLTLLPLAGFLAHRPGALAVRRKALK